MSRLVVSATLAFAGLSVLSHGSSGASSEALAHPGKVVYPTVAEANLRRVQAASSHGAKASSFVLSSHGGLDGIEVTTGTPRVYVVFWGSQWGTQGTNSLGDFTFSGDPSGMAPRVQDLLRGVGTGGETWSGVMTQYCDGVPYGGTVCPTNGVHVGYPTGGALAGVWYDNSAPSPTTATGNQLATEAVSAAGYFGNKSATSNRSAQYVIVSPTGLHPDGFNTPQANWCAWHDYNGDTTLSGGAAPSPYGDIAFTNLPYLPDMGTSCGANFVNGGAGGALDGVSIVEGHEYAETLTDQNAGYGYYDNATGMENGDKCAWLTPGTPGGAQNVSFATGSFAMQSTWSNATNACAISGPIETGQNSVNDFSISASPSSGSVVAGATTNVTVNTTTISGSSQSVALSVTGVPSGVTAAFSPTSVTSGGSSTLTITTSSSTAAGNSTLTITGTAASGSRTTSYALSVSAPPVSAFSLTANPNYGSVTLGHSISTTLSATNTGTGSSQSVALSVSGLPAGVSAQFASTSITAGGASTTLTFKVAHKSKLGTYSITVNGTGSSSSASTTYTLTVD